MKYEWKQNMIIHVTNVTIMQAKLKLINEGVIVPNFNIKMLKLYDFRHKNKCNKIKK